MKRIVAFITVLVFVFSMCGCSSKSGQAAGNAVEEHIEIEPLDGSQSFFLNYNPDRSWRLEAYVNVANSDEDNHTIQPDPTVNVRRSVSQYAEYSPQLVQVYFYLTGYKNKPEIDEIGMDRMQQVFDCARELGVKLVVRFAYQYNMAGVGEASDDIMLGHMKQLKPLLEKNVDLINVVEAGFLGSWGEWHSYKDFHNPSALLRGILEMTPEPLYVEVREPQYKDLILDTEDIYSRIGFHDDSFFGYRYCASAGSLNPGTEEWNQIVKESAVVPVGGETFWGRETNEEIDGFESILQFSAFRQNTFSLYHCFIEDGVGKGYEMEKWQDIPITPEWLDSNGILYSPTWFGTDGELERSIFDFVSDYLGYRIEAKSADISGNLCPNGSLKTDFKLVNYGFSAAFNMYSGFTILDEGGNEVWSVSAGDPSTWNSRDPENYGDASAIEYTISADIPLPSESGKYKLAFYFRNSAGTGARLNNTLDYSNGYTVFYEFEI